MGISKIILFLLVSLILFFLISDISAIELDFNFKSPSQVEINEEFEVEIKAEYLSDDQSYDIKIFVSNPENDELLSETYSKKWQTSFYYVQDVFPDGNTYRVRVIESPGDREICVRIRPHEKTKYGEVCKDLEVLSPESSSDDSPDEQEPKESLDNTPQGTESNGIKLIAGENKTILLNKPSDESSSKQESIFVSSKERTTVFVLIGFSLILALIVILLSMRKL